MKKDRHLVNWLREKLRPPNVVPIRKSWSWTLWWMVRLFILFCIRGC